MAAGPLALDALRVAAALAPLDFDADLVADAFTMLSPGPIDIATRRAKAGLSLLLTLHLIQASSPPDPSGRYRASAVTAYAMERHDPDPARARALRRAALQALALASPSMLNHIARHHYAAAERRGEPPVPRQQQAAYSDLERMAAFDLQTELVLRIGIQQLEPDTGSLREALTSLHSIFEFTRTTLRKYNIALNGDTPSSTRPSVNQLAERLLNQTLRPFLGRWHPALAAHEALRPPDLPAQNHEQAWALMPDLRRALDELSRPMNAVATDLAAISGADFGQPTARATT